MFSNSRAGIARGVQKTNLRGIDIFNAMAEEKKQLAAKEAAKNKPAPKTNLGKKVLNGKTQLTKFPASFSEACAASTTVGEDGTVIVKKESREEYAARRERLAAAKVEREKAKKLRMSKDEFRQYCHNNKACLNCGWPGHRKEDCPKGDFIPVW